MAEPTTTKEQLNERIPLTKRARTRSTSLTISHSASLNAQNWAYLIPRVLAKMDNLCSISPPSLRHYSAFCVRHIQFSDTRLSGHAEAYLAASLDGQINIVSLRFLFLLETTMTHHHLHHLLPLLCALNAFLHQANTLSSYASVIAAPAWRRLGTRSHIRLSLCSSILLSTCIVLLFSSSSCPLVLYWMRLSPFLTRYMLDFAPQVPSSHCHHPFVISA